MKRALLIFASIIMVTTPVMAVDWQAKQITRETALDKEDKTAAFKDAAGNIFFIDNTGEETEEEVAAIIMIKDTLYAWQSMKIKDLRFVLDNGIITAIVMPESLSWNSVNLIPNLPAGLMFIYENQTINYNFRIKKDNYFLRINGAFISEKVLCDKMSEAINTPQTFVQRRDPDYLLSHIDRIDAEMEMFRKSLIAVNNRGLFSNDGPVDDKIISRVVSLKKVNSKISKKEVKDTLERENTKVTDKALELIFNVYFYEFEK